MTASALADVRASLADFTLEQARHLAGAALNADGAASARAAATAIAHSITSTAPTSAAPTVLATPERGSLQ
jgi:phosphotransferase system enzyme I (PtsI)